VRRWLALGPTVIRRHKEHIKRLETRIETIYLDKLDGKSAASSSRPRPASGARRQDYYREVGFGQVIGASGI
jgi:hypothetical protein